MESKTIKRQKIIKKEIEDYYKTWVRRNFQKGVRDAYVYMGKEILVIIGIEPLSFVDLSIADDDYSKQVVSYSLRKVIGKNYPVLKENIELIAEREVENYFFDINIDRNMSCMTFVLKKGDRA